MTKHDMYNIISKMKSEEVLLNKLEVSNLLEIYGNCLTKKQVEILDLYVNQDLSLTEISENLQISRQAVYDNIKKSQTNLNALEEKLKLQQKKNENFRNIIVIKEKLNQLNNLEEKQKKQIFKLLDLLN